VNSRNEIVFPPRYDYASLERINGSSFNFSSAFVLVNNTSITASIGGSL